MVKRWMTVIGYVLLTIVILAYWIPKLGEPRNIPWTIACILSALLFLLAAWVKKGFGKNRPGLASFLLTGLSLPVIAVIWNAPTFDPESGYRSTVGHEATSAVLGLVILGGFGFLWYAWQRFLSN